MYWVMETAAPAHPALAASVLPGSAQITTFVRPVEPPDCG